MTVLFDDSRLQDTLGRRSVRKGNLLVRTDLSDGTNWTVGRCWSRTAATVP